MAGKITLNKYQMLGFNGWAGMTTDNHLSALFQSEPQRASDVIVQLQAYNVGNTLESFLAQFPTREFESDDEFYWDVLASASRNIPLVEARDENGCVITKDTATNAGIGGNPIYLVFGEAWFAKHLVS